MYMCILFFFFQAEDGIRDYKVTGVQTCALPICAGGEDLIKIIDFGIASVDDRESASISSTLSGTWRYMAPEQFDGKTSQRSEERRVGKECRSRWSPYH